MNYRGTEMEFSKESIYEIIEARVTETFEIVKTNLYNLNLDHLIPYGIVITGGSALLRDISVVAERVFDRPVRIGYPKITDNIWKTLENPIYGTALGMLELSVSGEELEIGLFKGNLFGYILYKIKEWFSDLIEEKEEKNE